MAPDEFLRRFAAAHPSLVYFATRRYRAAGLPGAAEEAEDTAQDVFLRAFPHHATIPVQPEAVFLAFVFTVCRNLCVDKLRRQGRGPIRLCPDGVLPEPDRAEGLDEAALTALSAEARDLFRACLQEMPRDLLQVLFTYIECGMHGPEAARRLVHTLAMFYRRRNAALARVQLVVLDHNESVFAQLPLSESCRAFLEALSSVANDLQSPVNEV